MVGWVIRALQLSYNGSFQALILLEAQARVRVCLVSLFV